MKKLLLTYIFFLSGFFCLLLQAETTVVGSFLKYPVSAHVAALGGNDVAFVGDDVNFAFCNPALLTVNTNKMINLNYSIYIAGSGYGSGSYSMKLSDIDALAIAFQMADYGTFDGFDENGVATSQFKAQNFALSAIYSRVLNKYFTIGVAFKPIVSAYEQYSSYALAADLGIQYYDSESRLKVGFATRNIGVQFLGYDSDDEYSQNEMLPLEISVGVSKQLNHAPFAFHCTMQNLERWNYRYATNSSSSSESTDASNFAQVLLRHFIVGVDILPPSNKFWLSVSYNFERGQELVVPDVFSLTGFSGGLGLKLNKFEIAVGVASYHQAATTCHVSLSTNLSQFGL